MQQKHLFEYAVIRVVPLVQREEFINVGVIVYCSSKRFLGVRYEINAPRLMAFSNLVDIEEIERRLQAIEQICKGGSAGGPIGLLPIASRFRWLAATKSTIVQTSAIHPGLCNHPAETLDKLFGQLVSCR